MGSILISVPDFSDDELLFKEEETRRILKFFWPDLAEKIGQMNIDNDVRRLAQSALVAAIDGSIALGFIYILAKTLVLPNLTIRSLARKLAQRFAGHWWKHAKRGDLDDARIFDSVRRPVEAALRNRLHSALNGIALKRGQLRFYALVHVPLRAWG